MPAKFLNKEQLEAVCYSKGPLLIIAGAGTGKTTVITERIKHLIVSALAKPSEILSLTFTEKAAREMEERVDLAMPYGYTQMWISTFHAFCERLLRFEALHIGLNPKFNLLTQAETIQFLRQNLFKFELNYFRPLGNPTKFIDGLIQHFSRLKDEDVSPEEYLEYVRKSKIDVEETGKYLELANAYKIYEGLKVEEGVMDFGDLISNTLKIFRTRKNILKQYQEQFQYILVDEFQDTNFAQNELAIMLAGKRQNITVCADDDQAIYRWRGAAISNVIQFRDRFPNAKIVSLIKNYRSTQEILDKSYDLIQNNNPDRLEVKEKIEKKLVSVRGLRGEKISFIHTDRVENEAEAVVKEISNLKFQISNLRYADFAILVRANSHAEPFMRALSRSGIPYQFLGPGSLFKQPEVKDLIAYLKVLANFEDSVAMYRVLAMDFFEIKGRDLAAISNYSKKHNISLFESCEQIEKILVDMPTREIINKLVSMIHRHLDLIKKETAGQVLYYFLEDTGMLRRFIKYKDVTDERRAQNITKFFNKIKTYEASHEDSSVFAVTDWIDLSFEVGESPLASDIDWTEVDAVNIITVHSAKGLEFPVVFLVNLVAQRFPTIERKEQIPIPQKLIKEILPVGDYHLQEERRLFYVGMTRARDLLYLTAANFYGEGKREKKVSPFVYEALGSETIEQFSNLTTRFDREARRVNNTQLSLLEWDKPEDGVAQPVVHYVPDHLSYSHIETFKQCPLHYKLKFILNIPIPPFAAQSFGTTLHLVLRDFYQAKIANKNPQKTDLLSALKTNWISEGYTDREHEKSYFRKGEKFLHEFWEKIKDSSDIPLAVEKPFVFRIKNLHVVGRIDRVDAVGEKIEIIDYKTGEKVPEQKEVDKNLQMTIYALAAAEVADEPFHRKPEKVILSFYYFEKGQKLTTTRTKEQLEAAKREILEWADKIAHSDFRCSVSEMCKQCEFRLLCDTEEIR